MEPKTKQAAGRVTSTGVPCKLQPQAAAVALLSGKSDHNSHRSRGAICDGKVTE